MARIAEERGSRPMPEYRALLAVDMVRFSANPGSYLPGLNALIPAVLEEALAGCGDGSIWSGRRFPQDTGDGYLLGTHVRNLPFLIDPFPDRLQEVLQHHDRGLAVHDRDLRLRLRVSVHVGPVPDDGPDLERNGAPTNEVCRLLDCKQIKDAINNADPDVTMVAAIVSQRAFEDAVSARYTDLRPAQFTQVTAEVPGKDFAMPGWLYVPRPSQDPHDRSEPQAPRGGGTGTPRSGGPQTNINGYVGQAITGDRISGIHFHGGSLPARRGENDE